MAQTIEEQIEDFIQHYGEDNIPHPVHEPIRFAHYVKVWKYIRERNETN
jgi:hypothetical protein